MIRHRVRKFKSLAVALKELEPFVRDGQHLRTGKPFPSFDGGRSRELLANWLICAVLNNEHELDRFTFTSDPTGSDGIIIDTATGNTWPTEHVMVPPARDPSAICIEDEILAKISYKVGRGSAYAAGKTLVVLVEASGGAWFPNRVARGLPSPLLFDVAWVVGLQSADNGRYIYGAACLDLSAGNTPTWLIDIHPSFECWSVSRTQ